MTHGPAGVPISAAAAILVLLVLLLMMNATAIFLRNKYVRSY